MYSRWSRVYSFPTYRVCCCVRDRALHAKGGGDWWFIIGAVCDISASAYRTRNTWRQQSATRVGYAIHLSCAVGSKKTCAHVAATILRPTYAQKNLRPNKMSLKKLSPILLPYVQFRAFSPRHIKDAFFPQPFTTFAAAIALCRTVNP